MLNMKKSLFFIILFVCTDNIFAQYYMVDTLRLNSAYRELLLKPNTPERQKAFFNAFPNNWTEFINLYRYISKKDYDLSMYKMYDGQINALKNKITAINDSIYCAKVINLSIGAMYDADAANALKTLLHHVMWRKTDMMIGLISSMTTADQMLFWQFYWSSIHKIERNDSPEYEKLYKLLATNYPEEMEIMAIAHKHFNGNAVFESEVRSHIGLKNIRH
jgi:hypothetical protein